MRGVTQCFYYIALYYRRSILDEPSVALSPSDVSVDPIDVDEVGKRLFCVCSGKKKNLSFIVPCMCKSLGTNSFIFRMSLT